MVSRARRRAGFPLHVTIASVFALLLLLVGVVLISYNFYEGRKIALLSADEMLHRSSRHMEKTISDLYGPAQNLVDMLSLALDPQATDLDTRLDSLPLLIEPLRQNPTIASIFVGYDNGDLFLVRPFETEVRGDNTVVAPQGSRYVVQSIDHAPDQLRPEEWLFLDGDLEVLDRGPIDSTGFDPRDRDWYRSALASEDQITTDFYIFFTTRQT